VDQARLEGVAGTSDRSRFDVFLSHNGRDKPVVEHLAEKLKRAGIEPWLDAWCLVPGGRWQAELSDGLRASGACAYFLGPHGEGDWAREELDLARDRAVKDPAFHLFPVLLPGVPEPFDPITLPPFLKSRSWVDLRAGPDGTRAFQALVNAIKGVPLGPSVPLEPRNDICPYRGLQTFTEDQAQFFFGRDGDVQRLIEKLKAGRFLAVLGPSGSGKSSLVRAGLLPELRRGRLPGSASWQTCTLKPGPRPLERLALQLQALDGRESMQRTLDNLSQDERTLHLAGVLALAKHAEGTRLLWVVDQAEELFTLCRDERERAQSIANLLYAASIPDGPSVVVFTLRADFYPRCAAYPDLAEHVAAQQFLVGPMDEAGLRQAIEEPARQVGLQFEAGLVDTIVDDVRSRPGSLPLLEHALLELWERRRGQWLTLEGYRESGTVQRAIAQRAETIYVSFSPQQQAIVRRALLRLTQPGEGTEDTRRRATLQELITSPQEAVAVEEVVGALTDARLLTMSRDEHSGERAVEVSHEALIRTWPHLRGWLEEDRAGLRVHRHLTEAAEEWERLGRDVGLLYRGARMVEATDWRGNHAGDLNEGEREFLEASVSLRERERRAVRRRVGLTIGGLLVAVLVLGTLAVYAFGLAHERDAQAQEATRQRDAAEEARNEALNQQKIATSREVAASATSQLTSDPELSVLLATQAVGIQPTIQADGALRNALLSSQVRAVLHGHTDTVNVARFSPDGQRIVTASNDESARVWDAHTGQQLTILEGHTAPVTGADFSPDGQRIVTASWDHTARVWDASTGQLLTILQGHTDIVRVAKFSPDGQRVVTASDDQTARVWAVNTGQQLAVLQGHADKVTDLDIRPDGQRIVTASNDETARVWDAHTGQQLTVLRGHTAAVTGADFSPDGQRILTASDDQTARVWDADSGQQVAALVGHTYGLTAAGFSPDGQRVVTSSGDRTARIWEASSGRLLAILQGHADTVAGAAFSPDGQRIVTAGWDGSARLWNANTGELLIVLLGHTRGVTTAFFSPDGQRIVTASDDDTARVWDASSQQQLAILQGHTSAVEAASFSPDSQRVVTASYDHTARVWSASTAQQLAVLQGHADTVQAAAYSPDGQRIVTASWDGTARVWDATTGQQLAILQGHTDRVYSAIFTPDGQRIVTASDDATARVWDASTGQQVAILLGHTDRVRNVDISPDGQRVVTASWDDTARVWDATTGQELVILQGHTDAVNVAKFSFDGQRVVTASEDQTARVWDAQSGQQLAILQGHAAGVASAAFSPDGQRVVTASNDDTARVWDASSGQSLVVMGAADKVTSAAFSPDGQRIVISIADGTARLYGCEAACDLTDVLALVQRRVTRELTPDERRRYLHEQPGP
jgi:WD40 repeat protein/energy-coupling factor transporter ATP-binding protein EcfA2